MKFSTATATVVGVAATAAAIMIPGPTAAKDLLDKGALPEDAHAIRHCIAQSCGNAQAPAAVKCRAWCLEVSGEKLRRPGGRKWRRQEASGWALRNKHELELDHVGVRVKHGLGPGEDHVGLKAIHERGSEDQGLKIMHKIGPEEEKGLKIMHKIGPEEEEGLKVMHKLDIEPRDADGALEAREVESVETGVVDNNNNNNNGRGAFGSLPGPVLTGVAEALRKGTNGKADEVDTAGVRHGRLGRRASAAASDRSPISPYAQAILDQHNSHRTNHSAPALAWSEHLANLAQQIGETCVYAHNTDVGGGRYGQNIGAGASPSQVPAALLTHDMYHGRVGFFPLPYGRDQPATSGFEKWGRFSQMVWQSTAEVGCATVDCSASGLGNAPDPHVAPWLTVCNYYSPAGNCRGECGRGMSQSRQPNPTGSSPSGTF